jgi:hypothetical protein
MGPTGGLSGPVAAMATYLAWHLSCHNGEDSTLLTQDACQEIHQPADASVTTYGYGMLCYNHTDAGGLVCTHNGSNQLNYYNFTLAFAENRGYVGYSNAMRSEFEEGFMVNEAVGTLFLAEADDCDTRFSSSVYDMEITEAPTSAPDEPTLEPSSDATTLWYGATVAMLGFAFVAV